MGNIDLLRFLRPSKKRPTQYRVWFYQHAGEAKQKLYKHDRYWYYECPERVGAGRHGCDSLAGAKGDLLCYEGTKVWSELMDL